MILGQCCGCHYWVKFGPENARPGTQARGTCHRFPPVLDPSHQSVDGPTESATHWIYPVTEAFDGCGEMTQST